MLLSFIRFLFNRSSSSSCQKHLASSTEREESKNRSRIGVPETVLHEKTPNVEKMPHFLRLSLTVFCHRIEEEIQSQTGGRRCQRQVPVMS